MTLYVQFDQEGNAATIFPSYREGSELVDNLTMDFLIANRRTETGKWVERDPEPGPTDEEIAAREAARAAEEAKAAADNLEQIEQEIARRAAPDALLRSLGKISIAELTARVAVIRSKVEAGE